MSRAKIPSSDGVAGFSPWLSAKRRAGARPVREAAWALSACTVRGSMRLLVHKDWVCACVCIAAHPNGQHMDAVRCLCCMIDDVWA